MLYDSAMEIEHTLPTIKNGSFVLATNISFLVVSSEEL